MDRAEDQVRGRRRLRADDGHLEPADRRDFLDWLAPPQGAAWVDIGAGNGAFTELIAARCKPSSIDGVDPSEGQLTFARSRPGARIAKFTQGDAMALPYPDKSFDIAVMALVIFFVPQPPKGVAEMARVLKPGGVAAAYAWDIPGGGLPTEAVLDWIARARPYAGENTQSRRVAHRVVAAVVDRCRFRTGRDPQDHGATHLRGP